MSTIGIPDTSSIQIPTILFFFSYQVIGNGYLWLQCWWNVRGQAAQRCQSGPFSYFFFTVQLVGVMIDGDSFRTRGVGARTWWMMRPFWGGFGLGFVLGARWTAAGTWRGITWAGIKQDWWEPASRQGVFLVSWMNANPVIQVLPVLG